MLKVEFLGGGFLLYPCVTSPVKTVPGEKFLTGESPLKKSNDPGIFRLPHVPCKLRFLSPISLKFPPLKVLFLHLKMQRSSLSSSL